MSARLVRRSHGDEIDTNSPLTTDRQYGGFQAGFRIEVLMTRNLPFIFPNTYDPFEEEARRSEIRSLRLA